MQVLRRLIFCLLLVCAAPWMPASSQAQVRWATARQDTLQIDLTEAGEVESTNNVTLAAPQIWSLDLQIIDIVPEGSFVDSGEVMVRFDPAALLTELEEKQAELDMRRAELRSMLEEHNASLRNLEREVDLARYTLELAKVQLEQLQFESEARREEGRLEVLKAEIALKEAETRLAAQRVIYRSAEKKQRLLILQAEGEVKEIQKDLQQLILRAPTAGLVVYHTDWDGSKPQLGDKVRPGQAVIDLPDLTRMQVKLRIHEMDIPRIRIGQRAKVRLEAFRDRSYPARVVEIAQVPEALERNSQVKVFTVLLEILESDSLLKPGMTATASIVTDTIPDAVLVPLGCVYEQNGRPVVFKEDDPKRPVPIKLGHRSDFYVQILEGVQPGERVAWNPPVEGLKRPGYLTYLTRLRTPDSLWERYFSDMAVRQLTFDYEAFRHRPPEPPGGAPGGTDAMLKQLGLPSGEVAIPQGNISLKPGGGRVMMVPGKNRPGRTSIRVEGQGLPPGLVIRRQGETAVQKPDSQRTKADSLHQRRPRKN